MGRVVLGVEGEGVEVGGYGVLAHHISEHLRNKVGLV